eukprot:761951-Hanusia_phi.AAC.1
MSQSLPLPLPASSSSTAADRLYESFRQPTFFAEMTAECRLYRPWRCKGQVSWRLEAGDRVSNLP